MPSTPVSFFPTSEAEQGAEVRVVGDGGGQKVPWLPCWWSAFNSGLLLHMRNCSGCISYPSVALANRLARRMSYMKLVSTLNSTTGSTRRQKKVVHTGASFNFRMEINHQKKQFYVIEQPQSSLLWRYKCIKARWRWKYHWYMIIDMHKYIYNI